MPRRYFHFQNGGTTLDSEGVDLPDMATTRTEAARTIAEMLREDEIDTLWHGHPLRLWVTEGPNGAGKTVLALRVVTDVNSQ